MTRYVAQRTIESLLVLAVMSVVIYALIGLMPGDPIDLMISANPNLTPADAVRLKALYGLDLPLYERYWNWVTAALGGDFGYSRLFSRPVLDVLPDYLGRTAILMGTSFVISVAIAIPTGIWAATKPYSRTDYVINLLSFAGISVPPFWLALLLIMLFAVGLGWLPAGGLQTVGIDSFVDKARHLALPVLALTLLSIAGVTRYVRAEMIGVLRQDYVRTARAKGVPEGTVVWRHALRNALIPVVTVLALDFGALFSGALITETVFSYPGMGKLIYDAILGNDFNLALVGLLFATLLTLVGNLLADLAYAKLDPRISYG
jgi:peptide/nickel transport system permease protein